MKESIESLASTKAGQPPLSRRCSIVPRVGWIILQRGQIPSLLLMSQCLVRDSTLALPERNLAWVTALETSYGDVPQVVKRGWVVERDMKLGWKYFKDRSVKRSASARSFFSQKSMTADLTSLLKVCLGGGLLRNVIG